MHNNLKNNKPFVDYKISLCHGFYFVSGYGFGDKNQVVNIRKYLYSYIKH